MIVVHGGYIFVFIFGEVKDGPNRSQCPLFFLSLYFIWANTCDQMIHHIPAVIILRYSVKIIIFS